MQNINTGYTPEFGLGAFFAGQNAANTQAANEEELARLFLANQRELSMQPLDVQRKQLEVPGLEYDAALARAKRSDPNYISKVLQGYMGQMNSQIAAGRGAMATEPSKTAADIQQNKNALSEAGLMGRLWKLKEDPTISLPTTNVPNKADGTSRRGDASWQVSLADQIARDAAALAIRRKEWESNPYDPELNLDIINKSKQLAALKAKARQPEAAPEPAPTPAVVAAPTATNTEYERLMQALTDTPEFRQKQQLSQQKTDATVEAAKVRAQAQLDLLKAKIASTPVKGAKTLEEALVRYQEKLAAGHSPTPEEQLAHENAVAAYNTKWQAQYKPGIAAQVGEGGKVGLINKPGPAAYVPKKPTTGETREINGNTYEKVEGGWQLKR
mgnify:CR=1 FL=1